MSLNGDVNRQEDDHADEFYCSAPGKVIVHGEHAVVYGKSAIGMSVDLRTAVHIKAGGNQVHITLNDMNADHIWPFSCLENLPPIVNIEKEKILEFSEELLSKIKHFLDDMHFEAFYPHGLSEYEVSKKKIARTEQDVNNSLQAFLLLYLGISDVYYNSKRIPMQVNVYSSLPCGSGFGSSSAFIVALTGALFKAYKVQAPHQVISDWAFQIDKLFHGKPSGLDNSICTFGGGILFREGRVQKHISQVPSFKVIVVNTDVPRNTKELVLRAREKYEKFTPIVEHILSAIDELSKTAWTLFDKENFKGEDLKELFEMNQHLLESLGVGHPTINTIIDIASKFGFAAKLTGAGGGGNVVILMPSDARESDIADLIADLEKNEFEYWKVDLGCAGIMYK